MHILNQLLLVSVAVLALNACGGSSSADEPEPSPPTTEVPDGSGSEETPGEETPDEEPSGFGVASRSPETGATNGAPVGDISITFTDPLISSTVSADTIALEHNGSPVATDISYEDGSRVVMVRPDEPLAPNTEYSVRVSEDLMAEDGSQFSGDSWSFTTAGNIGSTSQAAIDQCMSERDLEMLDRINDARAGDRSCGDEFKPAVAPLAWNCTIAEAAQGHSEDMADNNFFSHTGSDGLGIAERLNNAGYEWSAAAENIAAGQESVQQVMQAWLDSPGHCVNIMGQNYTEVGAALAENEESEYRLYWTQDFGRPR